MILLGRYYSPYVRRIAVSLRVLGIDYEHRPVSSLHDQDMLRKYNPVGRVPALVLESGESLIESSAILDYLDHLVGPTRSLIPSAGWERQRALQAVALMLGAVEKVAASIYEETRRPPDKVYQGWIDHCLSQANSALSALEASLGEAASQAERPSQMEITTTVGVDFIQLVRPGLIEAARFPRLIRLAERFGATPPFVETRPQA